MALRGWQRHRLGRATVLAALMAGACEADAGESSSDSIDADPGGPILGCDDEVLLASVAEKTVALTDPQWTWAPGVATYGIAQLAASAETLQARSEIGTSSETFLRDWADARLAEGMNLEHVNQMAPAWSLLASYRATQDPYYLEQAELIATHFADVHPRASDGAWLHAGQSVWVDTMFMGPVFMAELSRVTGDERWRDEALDQLRTHGDWLLDPTSGLYEHGVPIQDDLDPTVIPTPVHWARGNAWAALATAEVLSRTEGGAARAQLEDRLSAHLGTLASLQDGGGWHTVLDDDTTYVESSATAGIARAFALAADMGLTDRSQAREVVAGSCRLLSNRTVDGELGGVSGSTAYGISPEAYGEISADEPTAWGQGLWLALLSGSSS